MTPPVTVTPAEFTAAGGKLVAAGAALEESLGMFRDPAMWTAARAYRDYFGPATEAAETYARLAERMPDHVRAVAGRLAQGGDAFRAAADLFAATEAGNAAGMAGPR